MIQPIEQLSIYASPFGGELLLTWKLPSVLPASFKIYIFKRSKSDITQEEIDNYFVNINNLSNYNYNGLFVFDGFAQNEEVNSLSDITVLNGVTYYYKVVVRDETTGEYSEAKGISGVPESTLRFSVKDGKDIVYKALKKVLDNLYVAPDKKVQLGKDIQIVKNFSIEPIGNNYIMLERVNGATYYKFWANDIAMIKGSGRIKGDIDVDVIRAIFMTLDTSERRDMFCNIIRAYKQVLIRLCKRLGAINCDINIEGDYYNPQIHGVNATGLVVVFNLLIENQTLIPEENLETIIGGIIVDG